MIKINWNEVENFKNLMMRQGLTNAHEFTVLILYHGKRDSERMHVQLENLEPTLFDIETNRRVRGVYIYDLECKRMFLKFCDTHQVNALETAPSSGHPHVLLEFNGMSPEGKDVWVDITEAALQNYLSSTGV